MAKITLFLASIGILISLAMCVYIFLTIVRDPRAVDAIFFAVWGVMPYALPLHHHIKNNTSLVPSIIIGINISLAIILYPLFYGEKTFEWSLLLIPIYQFVVGMVVWGFIKLSGADSTE